MHPLPVFFNTLYSDIKHFYFSLEFFFFFFTMVNDDKLSAELAGLSCNGLNIRPYSETK